MFHVKISLFSPGPVPEDRVLEVLDPASIGITHEKHNTLVARFERGEFGPERFFEVSESTCTPDVHSQLPQNKNTPQEVKRETGLEMDMPTFSRAYTDMFSEIAPMIQMHR